MALIAETIARLAGTFPRAAMRPHASEESIQVFVDTFGSLPAEWVSFLRITDGLDLHLDDRVVGQILGLKDIEEVLGFAEILRVSHLVPVRRDGCGSYDCLDIGSGPTRGAVLFWDHEVYDRPAYLLGGDFAAYLDMWSDHVMSTFLEDGRRNESYRPKRTEEWPWIAPGDHEHPWPFDEKWMRARDPQADALLGNRFLRSRLLPTDDE